MAHIKPLHKLTLRDMMFNLEEYGGLSDGLSKLPLPDSIKIARRKYYIPKDMKEFTGSLCYGQLVFLTQKEENDFGAILRVMDGYYYPIVTGKKWDSDLALLFGKIVITCKVEELYPVAMHFSILTGEMIDREQELLHREPSKMELAAGIEKLNIFSELTALDFLRDSMKITVPEVLLTPYNECLVRFMIAKETAEFRDRYYALIREAETPKAKFKKQA
jgi:hypothetical protein